MGCKNLTSLRNLRVCLRGSQLRRTTGVVVYVVCKVLRTVCIVLRWVSYVKLGCELQVGVFSTCYTRALKRTSSEQVRVGCMCVSNPQSSYGNFDESVLWVVKHTKFGYIMCAFLNCFEQTETNRTEIQMGEIVYNHTENRSDIIAVATEIRLPPRQSQKRRKPHPLFFYASTVAD